ncbi:hypothetical protein VTI74DRAFT_4318 [Chaetomium olivicolor]
MGPLSANSDASDGDAFTVHVFVNHDPFMASIFLPDFFSNFPESAWRLPQRIESRPRPKPGVRVNPEDLPPWVDPREGLGRYVLSQFLRGTTTLQEVADVIEKQCGIGKKLHGPFTIFPQDLYKFERAAVPAWHGKPLPQFRTLSEVRPLDEDALQLPAEPGPSMLHLVLETKAAALRRIVGAAFLSTELGKGYEDERNAWTRLQSFNHAYSEPSYEMPRQLSRWRYAVHALSFPRRQQARGGQEVAEQTECLEKERAEAILAISNLLRQWAS